MGWCLLSQFLDLRFLIVALSPGGIGWFDAIILRAIQIALRPVQLIVDATSTENRLDLAYSPSLSLAPHP